MQKLLTDCILFGMLIAKRNGAMVVISGWSSKDSRGMVGIVACSYAYPACYVARFIRVLDQCNTAGAVKTCSGCRRRLMIDIYYRLYLPVKTPVFKL